MKRNDNIENNYSSWKHEIDLSVIKYEDEFYDKLFMCRDFDEAQKVLADYYFISEAFQNLIELSGNYDLYKNLIASSLTLTFKSSIKYGLETDEALDLLLKYTYDLSVLSDVQEILKIRTDFLISYYKLVHKKAESSKNFLVFKIKKYINENITKKITSSDIAEDLKYSKEYLAYVFKNEEGSTITDFVNKKKMLRAKFLLDTTNDKIYDIAAYMGFENVTSFNRVFKKLFKVTPSEYRQRLAKR